MNKEIESLIDAVFAGSATPLQKLRLKSWIEQSAMNASTVEELIMRNEAICVSSSSTNKASAFALGRVKLKETLSQLSNKEVKSKKRRLVGAMVILMVAFVVSLKVTLTEIAKPTPIFFEGATLNEITQFMANHCHISISVRGGANCRYAGSVVMSNDAIESLPNFFGVMDVRFTRVSQSDFLVSGSCTP